MLNHVVVHSIPNKERVTVTILKGRVICKFVSANFLTEIAIQPKIALKLAKLIVNQVPE